MLIEAELQELSTSMKASYSQLVWEVNSKFGWFQDKLFKTEMSKLSS